MFTSWSGTDRILVAFVYRGSLTPEYSIKVEQMEWSQEKMEYLLHNVEDELTLRCDIYKKTQRKPATQGIELSSFYD